MTFFILLTLLGAIVYITMNDNKLQEFLYPILKLLRGEGNSSIRWAVLILFPLLIGWIVYNRASPSLKTPTTLRMQHPTIPQAYVKLENPYRKADPELRTKAIEEGIILYQKNCRPCHGTKAAGAGPMARGFRLKPANFRDPGTIATVVESYAFWRIKEGGIGLPPEASPWDSSMPSWKDELTDDEIWKIILAEYYTAGVEPRIPEKLH